MTRMGVYALILNRTQPSLYTQPNLYKSLNLRVRLIAPSDYLDTDAQYCPYR